ncbi:hypothetical protein ACFXG4_03645 [Nocardia sp. NPDC059246]|uniref:hypothetical protein n=1 Tax=unclassified Nocardia TaxID=2637762 RepID=UPI0036A3CF4E
MRHEVLGSNDLVTFDGRGRYRITRIERGRALITSLTNGHALIVPVSRLAQVAAVPTT